MNQKIRYLYEKILQLQQIYWKKGKKFYYNLPLNEEEIQSFELKNNIKLPKDYRDFIRYIGIGDGPPQFSLWPLILNKKIKGIDQPWCDPDIYNQAEKKMYSDDFEDKLTPEEKKAVSSSGHGSLALLDGGCGTFDFLVINGKKRGQIWANLLAGTEGFSYRDKNFFNYYLRFVEGEIKATKKRVAGQKIKRGFDTALADLKNAEQCSNAFNLLEYYKNKSTQKKYVLKLLKKVMKAATPFSSYSSARILKICQKLELYKEGFQFGEKMLLLHKNNEEILEQMELISRVLEKDSDTKKFLEKLDPKNKKLNSNNKLTPQEEGRLLFLLKTISFPQKINVEAINSIMHSGTFNAEDMLYDLSEWIDMGKLDLAEEFCKKMSKNKNFIQDYFKKIAKEEYLEDGWENVEEGGREDDLNKYLSQLYYYWSFICMKKGDEKGARQHYEGFKKYKGKNFLNNSIQQRHHFNLNEATAALDGHLPLLALDILKECKADVKNNKEEPLWWNLKGCAHDELREYEKSSKAFEKSYSFNHWVVPYDNLCRSLIHLGKFEEAEKIIKKIKLFCPLYEWCYYSSAFLEAVKGRSKKARMELKKAFELGLKKSIVKEPELIALMKEI